MPNLVKVIKNNADALWGNGVSKKAIDDAEQALQLKFAEEYEEYLLAVGVAAVDGSELTGISNSDRTDVVKVTMAKRKDFPDVPGNLYVVEDVNIDGIVIWQHENGNVFGCGFGIELHQIADSITEYLAI